MPGGANARLAKDFRDMIMALRPDLPHIRMGIAARVVAVHDDNRFTVDVEVDDIPPVGQEPGDPWFLPDVPVSSLAGGDGWGMYVMPEEGSEVEITFKNGDPTQPKVSGSEFISNRTPIGGRAGSFTMADTSGQRYTLRPDTGEVIVRAYNQDNETAGARADKVGGSWRREIKVDLSEEVGGSATRTVRGNVREVVVDGERTVITQNAEEYTDYTETIGGKERFFQHARIVHGAARRKIAGGERHQVGGDRTLNVLGDHYQTTAKNRQEIVVGSWDVLVLGKPDDPRRVSDLPPLLVGVQIGSPFSVNVFGGLYRLPSLPGVPLMPRMAVPMVNGQNLAIALATWATAVEAGLVAAGSSAGGVTATFIAALISGLVPAPAVPYVMPPSVLSIRHFLGGPL